MADHLKPYHFKKGQSGNPGGSRKLPPELSKAAKLSKIEALERLVSYLEMDIHSLEAVLKDKSRKVMDHWIARICLMGIKEGDSRRLDFMFDRLFGKAAFELSVDQQVTFDFRNTPREKVIELSKQAIAQLEGKKDKG